MREKARHYSLSLLFFALFHRANTARRARSLRSAGVINADFAALAAVAFLAFSRNDSRDTARRAFSAFRALAADFFAVLIRPNTAAAADTSGAGATVFLGMLFTPCLRVCCTIPACRAARIIRA